MKKSIFFMLSICLFFLSENKAFAQPASVGWTLEANSAVPVPTCANWSATWCMGSGNYSEVTLTQGVNYTFENMATAVCGTALPTAWMQAWYTGGTSACGFGSIGAPTTNSVIFNAVLTGFHRIAISSNEASAPANTCGGGTGGDNTSRSAVLRYRQNTTVNNTTSTASICLGEDKTLTATLSGSHANPIPVWSIVAGGGNIVGNIYTPTTAGTKTIRATVGVCTSDINFDVLEPATAPTSISGTSIICAGESTTLTAIGGSNGDNSVFEWGTGTPGQNIIPGETTNTYSTSPLFANETYWVRRKNVGNCTFTTDPVTVTVTVNLPSSAMEEIDICENELPYMWNGIPINNGGNDVASYSTMNAQNCDSTVSLNLLVHPMPVVFLGNDTMICNGTSIVLDAGNPNANHIWNTGETSQTISVNQGGVYNVLVSTLFNCIATDNIFIEISPVAGTDGFNFIPLFNEESGKVSFSMINPQYVVSQEWDFGDGSAMNTEASPTHYFTSSGSFLVKLRVYNDCGFTEESLTIHVDLVTGIVSLDNEAPVLTIYPNPAKEYLILDGRANQLEIQNISVYNLIGSRVFESSPRSHAEQKISTSDLPSGIYSIRILTNKGFINKKFEVLK